MRANVTALCGGFIPGLIFFGTLWLTVRKGLFASRPASVFLMSSLLRMAMVIASLIFIATAHPERLLLAFGGFEAAKIVSIAFGRRCDIPHSPCKEANPCI